MRSDKMIFAKLFYREFLIQKKTYQIIRQLATFSLFCVFSTTLINIPENIHSFGIVFTVISIPIAFITLTNTLVRPDIEDGSLEQLLIIFSPEKIILAKYLAITAGGLISFLLTIPVTYFIFNIELDILLIIFCCASLLILLSTALLLLTAAIQGYFQDNNNFLSVLIMPLIIPNIILSGIILQSHINKYLIFIMLGIDITVIPVILFCAAYLINNIYSIS